MELNKQQLIAILDSISHTKMETFSEGGKWTILTSDLPDTIKVSEKVSLKDFKICGEAGQINKNQPER